MANFSWFVPALRRALSGRRSHDRFLSSVAQNAGEASGYHLGNGPSSMKAAVFWEPRKPLTFEDFHMPRPKTRELLIKTKGGGKPTLRSRVNGGFGEGKSEEAEEWLCSQLGELEAESVLQAQDYNHQINSLKQELAQMQALK
ncbi:hypothetical protein SUGI_0589020 [Cryptomeria japonica]|nr:hypothetical protein SUGI_0589020 [Cryptomeria japonica]